MLVPEQLRELFDFVRSVVPGGIDDDAEITIECASAHSYIFYFQSPQDATEFMRTISFMNRKCGLRRTLRSSRK